MDEADPSRVVFRIHGESIVKARVDGRSRTNIQLNGYYDLECISMGFFGRRFDDSILTEVSIWLGLTI
jgi:hypothetical protein